MCVADQALAGLARRPAQHLHQVSAAGAATVVAPVQDVAGHPRSVVALKTLAPSEPGSILRSIPSNLLTAQGLDISSQPS